LSRRDLVQALALIASAGAGSKSALAAADSLDFKNASIDHVSIHVADMQRSVSFYQNMFGFTVRSQDRAQGVVRLGNSRVLVSLNPGTPAGIIDHFSIGIAQFDRATAARYVTQKGAIPLEGDYAGLHVKDPDGVSVQIDKA
jgi:catechol 2,3-dioxygenase-like lactoylglutathione lyase family enzyme